MDRFDEASVRRFSLKIRFDWLKEEGVLQFFEKYFTELLGPVSLNSEQEKRLRVLRMLAPGDFKTVQQKNGWMERDKLSVDKVISELEMEQSYKKSLKNSSIGFR